MLPFLSHINFDKCDIKEESGGVDCTFSFRQKANVHKPSSPRLCPVRSTILVLRYFQHMNGVPYPGANENNEDTARAV